MATAVFLGALLLSGCAAPPLIVPAFSPADNAASPVVLGAIYNLTGGQAGLDVPSAQGARLAVEEANRAGGVLGRPVQLVLADGETDSQVIATRAAALIDENPAVVALFGFSDTDPVLVSAPIAAAAGRVFLTSGATSPKLPAQVPGYLFLACFGDNVQAAAGAEWAFHDLSARTASILFTSGSTYAELLRGYFQARFEELGGEIRSIEGSAPGDVADIAAAVERLEPADVVYLALTPDQALDAVLALRQAGYDGPIVGGDGFDVAGLWEQHPEVSKVYFTTHAYLGADNDDPSVTAFREAYSQAYPDSPPDAFAALGYDATRLLLEAVREAGSSDPEAVRNALAGLGQFQGVTGQLGFEAGSQIPVKSVAILSADEGSVRLVQQLMPEKVPAP